MSSLAPNFFHGGVPGRRVGDVLLPGHADHRYLVGCPDCEAQRQGEHVAIDPPTPPGWVYASEDRAYARFYASRAVGGTLYRVRLEGEVEVSVEDPPEFRAWRARRAVVLQVLETKVVLTMHQRRHLFLRWGGTPEEFDRMVRETVAAHARFGRGGGAP
jgi:hypothetical protein